MNTKNNKTTKTIRKNDNMNETKKEAFSHSIYNKENFESFKKLKINTTAKSINRNDLPSELSDETCEFIDIFHRKTVDESIEWNFYIDYETNEIIHCLKGENTKVKEYINSGLMKNRKIMTIHNHPKGTYSAPSATNFEILDHEFEDYEIICAEEEYWILKAKGKINEQTIDHIKTKIQDLFFKCDNGIYNNYCKNEIYNPNKEYSKQLPKFINNLKSNISLIKKEYK